MPGAYLWGWYPEGNTWVKLRLDIDGSIHVVGYVDKLEDIGDVILTAIANNDILYWNATDSEWQNIAHLGVADAHHAKYTDAEAKAAAVQAGAIIDGVTKAPTHNAVYDVKTMVEGHKDRHDPIDGGDKLDTAAPVKVGSANAIGTSHSLSRADHVHEREHAKYTDANARTAMGVIADDNPYHHNRAEEWGATEHTAIGDAAPHHTKYTNNEAKAAAVQAGAITNGVTKAPTHDAVFDVKTTADTATTPAEVATLITTHTDDPDAHHTDLATITFIIDGGGAEITLGEKGHLEIPFACTITGWTILADQSGSIVVDVWKDTYGNFPPTVGDTIAGSEKPTISAAQKGQDLTLTTWTTAIAAGDILAFNVDSVTDIERVTISLKVTKS